MKSPLVVQAQWTQIWPILTPILPEDIDADQPDSNADERSLKDTFSTLDPTASPFC